MKMIKYILLIKFLIISSFSNAFSSIISCSYIYEGKSYPLIFEIIENKVIEKNTLRDNTINQLLSNDNKMLMFGVRVFQKKFHGYQITIINKLSGELVSTSLFEAEKEKLQKTATVYGLCIF